ncbi:Glycerone-phosphate O-acyltransferase [Seminavis robusta]|uniref:Fatty acyl-CoA reductase n=1 Tax=Seminavis robusta TaxID=568900 RepID=A0A9N8D7F8_9STRA|nr:Glycerone-phosphate O-acyltransferase [Seminavis robusta]|eukprot:Sro25_g016810.1 Glycerone-phosphate O-acyltransferase (842) ;mRNA; f:40016-42541
MCSISNDSAASRGELNNRVSVPPLVLGSIVALIVALLWRLIPSTAAFAASVAVLGASVVGFLACFALFVDVYAGPTLRKATTSASHIANIVKKEESLADLISDLNKITNPEGLTQLWKREIHDNEKAFKLLLTGVTGYVGRAFLFQLLREIAQAEEDGKTALPHKVYVMARGKARKNLTAAERLEKIRDEPMFAPYKKQWDDVVMAAQSGDLQDENCGMSDDTVQMLADAQITHVVHCAADVNFNRPLPESAGINISPALQLQALASKWSTCTRFVHCSTAFVNPGPGTDENPMPEALFSLGKYDPQDLYDSMMGDQQLALKVKAEFGFPNNYVLTKCVAEHLVTRHNDNKTMELRICRPAVVGPAWVLPEQGWNGDKPSTISGVFLLWGTRVIRFAPLIHKPMPVIPVDVVAAGILHSMIDPAAEKKDDEFPIRFRNLIWSHKSQKKPMHGVTMAKQNIQAAMDLDHFTATEAAVSFLLLDIVAAFPAAFDFLHSIFNLGPLYLLQFVCWAVKTAGIKSVLEQVPVVKLFKFSDMLTLYKPYMGRDYKFTSSLHIPESFDINRYSASLFVATQTFWSKMFPGTIKEINEVDMLPKGRLDLWWALTQPCSSFYNRLVGYLACKILRAACLTANVDYLGSANFFDKMVELDETMSEQKHCVVLAPNHKSAMDYILIKYVAFFMSLAGIDAPVVLAKNELEDSELTQKLAKAQCDRHLTVAAFLEGSPSTDGSIGKPSAKALGKIVQMDSKSDYTVVPMGIEYKATSDSEIILQATKSNSDLGLVEMLSLYWEICVLNKTKPSSLGDIRVSFGTPITVKDVSGVDATLKTLHSEQTRLTTATN